MLSKLKNSAEIHWSRFKEAVNTENTWCLLLLLLLAFIIYGAYGFEPNAPL